MSGPKLISPLLDHFVMGDAISSHDGVRCYPAMREDSDEKYIVKVVSIPASQVQLEALLLTGAYRDQASALAYFKELADSTVKEAEGLQMLSKLEGFVSYEGWQIAPMDSGVGYDVYLVGTYKRSLDKHLRRNPMTHLSAINLGLDLCSALAVCRRAGCLFVDLKPSNVFVSDNQTYHIGDLGIVPLSSLKYASLPDKYRSSYTAPEIKDAFASLNETVDIYALGLILYQAYNNGELPFEGTAPTEPLPAPMYADYEMSEIILKACAPAPADRWQNPSEMGQALVGYMQRNGANDTPIIPPVTEPEILIPEEEALEEQTPAEVSDEELPAQEDAAEAVIPMEEETSGDDIAEETEEVRESEHPEDEAELSFIDNMVSDETAPNDETAVDLAGAELSDEMSEILAQADELIAHEAPAPVVAPEPVDIPMPDPIVLKDDEPEESAVETTAESESDESEEESSEETPELKLPENEEAEDEYSEEEPAPKKHGRKWIAVIIILALLAGLAFGGYYFYQNYYLQSVTDITLEGFEDQLTVRLTTGIHDEALTVICTDTYGISTTANVTDGVAAFTGLNPATLYNITVEMDGFHQIIGKTTASYTTAPKTSIVSFTAITGATDGSVILSFTVDGPDPDDWTIAYSAEGEEEKTVNFSGHSVTVADLSVGSNYTFRLVPTEDLYLDGTDTITYTASKVLYAQNLHFETLEDNAATLSWDAPEEADALSWTVTHYNKDGEIVSMATVTEPTITLTLDDLTQSHTFEVLADGMTQSTKIPLSANPISITSILTDDTNFPRLYLQWSYDGYVPEDGWIISVHADGSDPLEVITTADNTAELAALIPGAHYKLTFQAADGTTVFNDTYSFDVPEAEDFEDYWLTRSNITLSMCRTPEQEYWSRRDLTDEDFTTTFSADEKASFSMSLNRSYAISDDQIVITFVTRDSNGKPVSIDSYTQNWSSLWYTQKGNRYGQLNIPTLPTESGDYTIEIYFNGQAVGTQEFTIQ